MKDRYGLLQRGLFPETLPPCFTSVSLKRSLSGLVKDLNSRAFHKRPTDYVVYSGTKHDRSRRYFGSPNPISYFYVASFIADHWRTFEGRFDSSPFSVSRPKVSAPADDRPIVIPSLSELATVASRKLRYAEHILKTDIAQFFPSVYTHAISWSAHGIEAAKADQDFQSENLTFNRLDFFVRNCQRGETLGLLVGPDAFRLIAEFICSGLDQEVNSRIGAHVIGAARHVDDYYIGLKNQAGSKIVLSGLRDTLQRYSLHINDAKTREMPGVEPLNEVWAQDLRADSRKLQKHPFRVDVEDAVFFINKALNLSHQLASDSPVRIALRTMDQVRAYDEDWWSTVEPYMQRMLFHHPHCIDYVALLVVKRVALDGDIDRDGWGEVAHELVKRHLRNNHHHEVVWLTWLLLSTKLDISEDLVSEVSANDNAHLRALVVAAFVDGRIKKKPPIKLGEKLETTDRNWLVNLVAKACGYTGASFSGLMSAEFDHLAKKRIKLIDFKSHIVASRKPESLAISRTRYGYDSDHDEDDDNGDEDEFGGWRRRMDSDENF